MAGRDEGGAASRGGGGATGGGGGGLMFVLSRLSLHRVEKRSVLELD